jgi:hypothetical protein
MVELFTYIVRIVFARSFFENFIHNMGAFKNSLREVVDTMDGGVHEIMSTGYTTHFDLKFEATTTKEARKATKTKRTMDSWPRDEELRDVPEEE